MEKTIEYLTKFFLSRYPSYEEMMRDAGSSHFPEAFVGEDYVIQSIRNIVHNIADNYADLSIPNGYASPNLLRNALVSLRDMADAQFLKVDEIRMALGGDWLDCISQAQKMNEEVREAITHALSLEAGSKAAPTSSLDRLIRIANRIPAVSRQLLNRRNEKGSPRETLSIKDEYDVQDLLHAILRIDFDDIRPEEWCPSYAGSSKRTDFLLKDEKIVVEVKKTRPALKDREVGEELTIDIAYYKNHPECKHLVCLVWDTDHFIQNSVGLANDLERANGDFVTVRVVS